MANVRFARLEDPEFRASNNIPSVPKRPQVRADKARVPNAAAPVKEGPQRLQVPLGDSTAVIPVGISEDDFKLLMQTLRLWKPTFVRASGN